WKPVILFCPSHGINRFGAMRRAIPAITKHMLTQQLRELEADGIIERTVYAEVPPRVDYTLTERGASLRSVISAMKRWGEKDMALGHARR
ncbi:MAG: helix-turn-helix domain-containing protein, partial [Pseudomonadota bacterium]